MSAQRSQHFLLDLRISRRRGAEYRDVKLSFLDLVYKFYTSERDGRVVETLKAEHRPHSLFDSSMVLFNHIIERAISPHDEIGWRTALGL